jgi:hypothetical protein
MKLKIHNRIYNWRHIREIFPDTKYVEGGFYPRIVIIFSNGNERFFNFDLESYKKAEAKDALRAAQDILDKAIAEMA